MYIQEAVSYKEAGDPASMCIEDELKVMSPGHIYPVAGSLTSTLREASYSNTTDSLNPLSTRRNRGDMWTASDLDFDVVDESKPPPTR